MHIIMYQNFPCGSAVIIILYWYVICVSRYHRRKVFAGLADGKVAVFDPQNPSGGHTHLIRLDSTPIVACRSLGRRLMVASQSRVFLINTATMEATVSPLYMYIVVYMQVKE